MAEPATTPLALTPEQAAARLANLPDWELVEGATKLLRKYQFKNWKQAFAFTGRLSELAEAEKHHPDVQFGWGYCNIYLQTHTINGLQDRDFQMAAKISTIPTL